ncbi:MAG: class I SAM-dependent methyltransferase [Hyphomicrobiales bacterium]
MHVQAPFEYVRDYYERVQVKNARYPDVAAFWLDALGQIDGLSVLNVGCGPMFYDNMSHFARAPERYVGLDFNMSSFDFLRRSDHPHLLEMKARAEAAGTETEFVCADIFECADRFDGQFDSVLGVGFFATFHGAAFDRLLALMCRALKPQGQLLKITWHGPHRSRDETRDKLRYGYDSPQEPGPEELVAGFERAGFALRKQSILNCEPDTIGWDAIQVCLFQNREEGSGA